MTFKTLLRSAVALAAVAAFSGQAGAAYMVTTSVGNFSITGGTIVSTGAIAPGTTVIVGSTTATATNGGTVVNTSNGSSIYFFDDARTANVQSVPNEQIFVTNTGTTADSSVLSFTLNVGITNNGQTLNPAFTVSPDTIALNYQPNGDQNYLVTAGTIAPPTTTVGGTVFNFSTPQATSGDINTANNGALSAVVRASAAVPEPASVAMLGLGLAGVAGLGLRRRLA